MLYDQAQLAPLYLIAYQLSGRRDFADVARGIFRYVERDLSDPAGGFYSAEDADSYARAGDAAKREGAFYVWTMDEVQRVLSSAGVAGCGGRSAADLFAVCYDVQPAGNVERAQDPHGELTGQSVLIARRPLAERAASLGVSAEELQDVLRRCREALFASRAQRPRPHRDDKILASWNG